MDRMGADEFKDRYIRARKALIEAEFSHLNEAQREAVLTTEGPLLLLAGAGSGKTTVLINRIANLLRFGSASDSAEIPKDADESALKLLENPDSDREKALKLAAYNPVEPWRIIAITFTNKAAGELKTRLEAMLGPSARDIWAMTFHSACARILRTNAEHLGFGSDFAIYDSYDSESLMKRIIKERDLDDKLYAHRMVLNTIGRAKDALISPDEYKKMAENSADIRKIKIGELYAEYALRLNRSNAMDFDDLIYFTVRLMRENEEIRSFYRRKFRYVLIDEYQDTNNLQYLLATALTNNSNNICVVGDDDQSIYRFRGATIENILNFESQYKDARVIRLERNYRSTSHILNAANAVIKNNQARKGKNLWTEKEEGIKPALYRAENEADEARHVANQVMLSNARGELWRDNAVLYRMNAQSNQLEYAFKRNGIPYRVVGGMRFFDRAEVKDILAYLAIINAPRDEIRLLRIINTPSRGIGQATIDKARELAAANDLPLYDIISNAAEYPELERGAKRLLAFVNMIEDFKALEGEMPLDVFYDLVLERTGYIRALRDKITDENLSRIDNVRELKSNILSFMKTSETPTLAGFLDEVALYTDLGENDKDADSVIMMTMHAAKGLEFKNVCLVGAEEGIFPSERSRNDPKDIEEERRLCYVAITRAMERLTICCAKQRTLFGKTAAYPVSRFIGEIPIEHIDRPFEENPRSATPPPRPLPGIRNAVTYETPAASNAKSKAPDFKAGDKVIHKVFGAGQISKMTAMGGDFLLEIEFEANVTKRLMLRAAAQYMKRDGQ